MTDEQFSSIRDKAQRFFERNCPRLKCKDCAVKDGDVGQLVKPRKKEKCKFYEQYPNGYAGGYVLEGEEYRQVMEMDCPREFVWCIDCNIPCRRRNVTSLDFE